jgi:hypothetical protein
MRHDRGSDLVVIREEISLRDPVFGEENAVGAAQANVGDGGG